MRTYPILLFMTDQKQIIKNLNIPACKNCIYYKPPNYDDFTSSLSRCKKIGIKDIITDEINYEFTSSSRNDETKCGEQGVYFVEEQNLTIKIMNHYLQRNFPIIFIISAVALYYAVLINTPV